MGKDAELLEAARVGNLQVVDKILSSKARRSGPLASLRRGPGVNTADGSGYTCLHHAALNGHHGIVCSLLRYEASPNVQDLKGSTPLHLAAWAGHAAVVKALMTRSVHIPCSINHQNHGGETALHCSAQYGHTEAARILLEHGGDPTLPNLKAETPLDLAAQYGRLETAEQLIRTHPDLLRPYTPHSATAAVFPHTPLHRASRNGHLSIVRLLLSHGHHVNVRTGHGSPLHEAALGGKVEVVRALLEAGGDAEVRNDLGLTVLDTIGTISTPITREITGLIKSRHSITLVDLAENTASVTHVLDISNGGGRDRALSIDIRTSNISSYASDFSTILSPSFFNSVSSTFSSTYSSTQSSFSSKHSGGAASPPNVLLGDSAACSLESKASDKSSSSASNAEEARACTKVDLVTHSFSRFYNEELAADDAVAVEGGAAASPVTVEEGLLHSTTAGSPSLPRDKTAKEVTDFIVDAPKPNEVHVVSETIRNNLNKNVNKNYEKTNNFPDFSPTASEAASGDQSSGWSSEKAQFSPSAPVILEDISEAGNESDDDDNITSMVLFRSSPVVTSAHQANVVAKISNVIPGSSLGSAVYDELSYPPPGDDKAMPQGNSVEASNSVSYQPVSNNDLDIEDKEEQTSSDDNDGDDDDTAGGLNHIYAVPSYPLPPPSFTFSSSASSPSPSSRHSVTTAATGSDTCSLNSASVTPTVDDMLHDDNILPDTVAQPPPPYPSPGVDVAAAASTSLPLPTSPLFPPGFPDPVALGCPYENVLIPTVVELPGLVTRSRSVDGEKHGGRMPSDRRSTCSAKTLDRPTRGHDRGASRSSTSAEHFYSTTTTTTSSSSSTAATTSTIRSALDVKHRPSGEKDEPRGKGCEVSATRYIGGGKTRNQSESDRSRREKYREKLTDRSSVDNWLSDRNESWLSDRDSRLSDREGRYSDRESRFSDRDSRGSLLSDCECCGRGGGGVGVGGGGGGVGGGHDYSDRESQYSDLDGPVSEAGSEWSVYDVPPPPRAFGAKKRGSSGNQSVAGSYEVPPPPRSVHPPSRHSSRDELSPRAAAIQSKAPPKPPRRSMCPPSPHASTGDELESDVLMGVPSVPPDAPAAPYPSPSTVVSNPEYEMICFASTGTAKRRSKHKKHEGRTEPTSTAVEGPALRSKSCKLPARSRGVATSDSDSDHDLRGAKPGTKTYSQMSFKPVKSRRTSKSNHSYENVVHKYENQQPHINHHSSTYSHQFTSTSPLPPPCAPPPTPMLKQPPETEQQPYKQQKHHHSSPSLAPSSLSLPPPSATSSTPSPTTVLFQGSLEAGSNPRSVPATAEPTHARKEDGSAFSFSGYHHINRISSAISKNTQQLFKSFSTIATTNSNASNNTGRSLSKAFTMSSAAGSSSSSKQDTAAPSAAAEVEVMVDPNNAAVGGEDEATKEVAKGSDDEMSEGGGAVGTEHEEEDGESLNNGYCEEDSCSRPKDLDLSSSSASAPPYQPLSPTHYQQPPTPDHPPPSAEVAQTVIKRQILFNIQESGTLERARRLSDPPDPTGGGVILRRPHQPSFAPGEGAVGVCPSESSGSLNSDRSGASGDHVIEELHTEQPFGGLYRGSTVSMEWLTVRGGEAEVATIEGHRPSTYSPPPHDTGPSAVVGERLSNPLLSPLDEVQEWARVQDIMASFGSGIARESVFMAELEQEFQRRLGLSLSPSQQGLGILADVTKTLSDSNAETKENGSSSTTPTTTADTTTITATTDTTTTTTTAAGDAGNTSEPIVSEYDSVSEWLLGLGLQQYESAFLSKGYDSIDYLNGVLAEADYGLLGVTDVPHVAAIKAGVATLPASLPPSNTLYKVPNELREWLESIQLIQYEENFSKNGFGCMDRVRKMWEVELTMVLEVTKPGHRRRILTSLGDRPIEPVLPQTLNPHDLSLELSKLNSDICELKEQLFADLPTSVCRERRPPDSSTATIRRSGKKTRAPLPPALQSTRAQPTLDLDSSPSDGVSLPLTASVLESLPLRRPSQLVVVDGQSAAGGGSPVTTWKHDPGKLITSSVQYVAQYLGSTHVKELRGTESTMRSIQKVRRSADAAERVERRSGGGGGGGEEVVVGVHNTIVLAISYTGVRFMHHLTQELICEHEIRNIHCACQDADDLSHFAYITKDLSTKGHYCHVFRVDTRDQATDIILTLGEAFEVAYQLALREQQLHQQQQQQEGGRGGAHSRTLSECVRRSLPQHVKGRQHSHTRSHSTVARPPPISSTDCHPVDSHSGGGSFDGTPEPPLRASADSVDSPEGSEERRHSHHHPSHHPRYHRHDHHHYNPSADDT